MISLPNEIHCVADEKKTVITASPFIACKLLRGTDKICGLSHLRISASGFGILMFLNCKSD